MGCVTQLQSVVLGVYKRCQKFNIPITLFLIWKDKSSNHLHNKAGSITVKMESKVNEPEEYYISSYAQRLEHLLQCMSERNSALPVYILNACTLPKSSNKTFHDHTTPTFLLKKFVFLRRYCLIDFAKAAILITTLACKRDTDHVLVMSTKFSLNKGITTWRSVGYWDEGNEIRTGIKHAYFQFVLLCRDLIIFYTRSTYQRRQTSVVNVFTSIGPFIILLFQIFCVSNSSQQIHTPYIYWKMCVTSKPTPTAWHFYS